MKNHKDEALAPREPGAMRGDETVPKRPLQERIAALLLVACLVGLAVTLPDTESTLPVAQTKVPNQRRPMPAFTFPTLDGKAWALPQHRGHVVLLNFWATWCPPCRAETPDLVKIANDYRARGLDVAGVSMDNSDLGGVRGFAADNRVPYPILLPTPGSPATASIQGIPTTFLIDRQGRVVGTFQGALDEAALRPQLERLLGEPQGE